MTEPFFTIGHATRPLEEFIALLRANGVTRLVDVRTVPRSRMNPQYNSDSLPASLADVQIAYSHLPSLGGRRPRQKHVAPEVNGFWENQSFHNYADYAMSREFAAGLERLVEWGREGRCAVMCAETLWWQCHRRIITDYLLARGEAVFHIVKDEIPEPARITPEAAPAPGPALVYPPKQAGLFPAEP
jgi:uncharacterized protein (DUF488 family)